LWADLVRAAALLDSDDLATSSTTPSRRDRAVAAAGCVVAAALGDLFISPTLRSGAGLASAQLAVDVTCGLLAVVSLWWRRRWPVGVALCCLLLGTLSISATPAGLLAQFSLAVHGPARRALLVAGLWVPSVLAFALYSSTTDPLAVLVRVVPIVLAVTAWGMFIRARRQLLHSLRDRAQRAEADQRQHEDQARMAERTRIAREMHDVLGHRISLLALHAGALEVRPDLPPAEVRATAELMRLTARQALEELRTVIGVLRKVSGDVDVTPSVPPSTLAEIPRIVEDTRRAGVQVSLDMQVDHTDDVPSALARDAYRIVQEALTNISKHARGSEARVELTGASGHGLHITVRNTQPVGAQSEPALPGSGAGLLGLRERVDLAGGTLVHGPDGSSNFLVQADLPW
jgi:signal transduction histidine kinase